MKLSAVRSIVRGKRVVLVDDSIVRGTTSRRIVTMLKEAGATEVHVRIASPPMISPCFYGVDTSTYDELISARKNPEGVCEGDRRRFAGIPLARVAAGGRRPQGALHGLLHGTLSHGAVPVARGGQQRCKMLGDAKRSLRGGRRSDAAI